MIEGVWMGHEKQVLSLSWSPGGSHIASGSFDGTILIRKAENGKVEVGPIETEQRGVWSLAYSPLGDRIASGGNKTICIWDMGQQHRRASCRPDQRPGTTRDIGCVVFG
jgi:WD40 repeat protein